MKKYLICLFLVFGAVSASYGQNVSQLIKTASKAEKTEKVKIGRFMMSIGKLIGGVNNMPVARGIHSLEIYELSECDMDVKRNIAEMIDNMKDGDGYETLVMVKDTDSNLRILAKKKKNVINDIVILCSDEADPSIIRFTGKIKEGDIQELIENYSN